MRLDKTLAAFLACVAVCHAGCRHLVLEEDDSGGATAAKVGGRVLVGIATLGISEAYLADATRTYEANRIHGQMQAQLPPEPTFHEKLEAARSKAALVQLLGFPECQTVGRDSSGMEVEGCEWRLGEDRYETVGGGSQLTAVGRNVIARTDPTRTIQVEEQTIIMCILPLDGSERTPGSCTIR